jgi:hypothetical protein
MTNTGARRATRTAAAAAALWGAAIAFAAPVGAADIEVQVATVDGKKFTGTLYAGGQALPVDSGKAKLTVRNLDLKKRIAIAADLKVAEGKGTPPLRYLGVIEVLPGRGPVQVKAELVKDINLFCSGCHPSEKEPVQEGQIVRDLHSSGQELTGRYLAQVGKFNKEYIETKRKQGKERPPEPVVLEERVVIVNGKEVRKYFYTCESCHTVHWKTPWEKYARAAFTEKSTLCAGCHY